MKKFVTRVIEVTYDPEDLVFDSDAKYDAFLKALGRMVMFGMKSDAPRDLEVCALGIDKTLEMTGVYWPAWERGTTYTENKAQYALEEALVPFKNQGRPFVLGGIPRDEGATYSFHS